jgi:hypothetical protein
MAHVHECPTCGKRWECGDANYQDECPYPTRTLCIQCWARAGAPTSVQRDSPAGKSAGKMTK